LLVTPLIVSYVLGTLWMRRTKRPGYQACHIAMRKWNMATTTRIEFCKKSLSHLEMKVKSLPMPCLILNQTWKETRNSKPIYCILQSSMQELWNCHKN